MKRITFAALALLLASCRTGPEPTPTKDYAALADAAVAKFTISDNNAYGFEPEGRFDPNQPVLETRQAGPWTVYKLPGKKSGFDSVEVTVDESGAIVRLQFSNASRSALGWRNAIDIAYQDLRSKYKAVQRIGDLDTAELTVYVASDAAEWKQHYIQYLQLRDEPSNMGVQNCWILQPHLNQIQATIRREGTGSVLVIDFQTKKYAETMKAKARASKPTPPED